MTSSRPVLRARILAPLLAAAALGACSLPRMAGLGSYYQVTDPATGRVYFADELSREDRGIVEFRDGATGAWVSLAAAEYQEISAADYRAGLAR